MLEYIRNLYRNTVDIDDDEIMGICYRYCDDHNITIEQFKSDEIYRDCDFITEYLPRV